MSSFRSRSFKRRIIGRSIAARGGDQQAREDLIPLFGLSQGRPFEDIGDDLFNNDDDDFSIF